MFNDPNRLRWGDLIPSTIPGTFLEAPNPNTIQIVNARAANLPETWTIFLFCKIDHEPPGGVLVTVQYNIVIGVGAATAQFTFTFNFGPAIVGVVEPDPYSINSGPLGGGAAPILFGYKQLELPAMDIQINATLFRSGLDVDQLCQVGAWVAPRVSTPQPQPERSQHTNEPGQPRWMPHGFEDGELRYK
jgi:hypothetical protein